MWEGSLKQINRAQKRIHVAVGSAWRALVEEPLAPLLLGRPNLRPPWLKRHLQHLWRRGGALQLARLKVRRRRDPLWTSRRKQRLCVGRQALGVGSREKVLGNP